MKTESY